MKIEMKFHKRYVARTSLFNKLASWNIVETFYFLGEPDDMDMYINMGRLDFEGHFLTIYRHKTFGTIVGINTNYRKERFQ